MVTIELALFAKLSSRYPVSGNGREPRPLDLDEGTTVGALVQRMGFENEPRITFVNGRHARDEHALADGDRLAIFPPIAGG